MDASLIAVYAQTIALSALLVVAGRRLLAVALPEHPERPRPLSFSYGAGYFLGTALFQSVLVVGARLTSSARVGLGLAVMASVAITLVGPRPGRASVRAHAGTATAALMLVAAFTVTNATAWLMAEPAPSPTPTFMTHLGSVHSGRYANYAILIDVDDRIPFVDQNMGQSLMAASNAMLGMNAPLAALMSWIPVGLAALALAIFGTLRAHGLTRAWSLGGAFFVLFCNVTCSLVATALLDNGFPLVVLGYFDAITSLGSLLVLAVWAQELVVAARPTRMGQTVVPGLFALFWTWTAPQNVLVVPVMVGTLALCRTMRRSSSLAPRFARAALAFAAGTVLGVLQLGPFLLPSLREPVSVPTFDVPMEWRVRLALPYVERHWTDFHYGEVPRFRPSTQPDGDSGMLHWHTSMAYLVQSARLYGFLLMGLAALGVRIATMEAGEESRERLWTWLCMAVASFAAGYAVVLCFDLGERKWWLTRFLMPAMPMCLMAGVLGLAPQRSHTRMGPALVGLLALAISTYGPLVELGAAFHQSFVERADIDPLAHRLDLLVHSPGPFGWATR